MWVCLCCAVSSSTIRRAIDQGATTVRAVSKACGAGTDCAKCRRTILSMLSEVKIRAGATNDSTEPEG